MTTILACATGDSAIVAADTRTNIYERPVYDCNKIVRYADIGDSDILFGVCGDYAIITILSLGLDLPQPPRWGGLTEEQRLSLDESGAYDTWAKQVAMVLTDACVNAGLTEEGKMNGTILMVWHNMIWTISHCFAIRCMEGFAAVGSGEEAAMGAMYAMKDLPIPKEAERNQVIFERVVRSVQIAIKLNRRSGGPVRAELLTWK